MPTYEFDCQGCGTFEVVRSMAELRPEEPCPACGDRAERILSAFGMVRGRAQATPASRGGQPRVVRKESEPRPAPRKAKGSGNPPRTNHSHGRPWMMGH